MPGTYLSIVRSCSLFEDLNSMLFSAGMHSKLVSVPLDSSG